MGSPGKRSREQKRREAAAKQAAQEAAAAEPSAEAAEDEAENSAMRQHVTPRPSLRRRTARGSAPVDSS
eukprot:4851803-Pleurochrysis_carterae.AAC.1